MGCLVSNWNGGGGGGRNRRSSVTRDEKMLNERMKHDENLKKQWSKIEMQQTSS